MGKILNLQNLRSYMRKYNARPRLTPDWPIDDLLYIRLPVLAVRNYFNDSNTYNWTLTWKKDRNLRMAFQMTGSILTQWQAFRPKPSTKLLRRLELSIPRTISRFQRKMRSDINVKSITAVKHGGYKCNEVLFEMSRAIADIARHKGVSNPMLGSKIMNFLFPEFFPVWDTGWIKNQTLGHYKDVELPNDVQRRLSSINESKAAIEYARYVYLMITDQWDTRQSEYKRMQEFCFKYCERRGYYRPRIIIEDNYLDLTPLFFELCLLGKHC